MGAKGLGGVLLGALLVGGWGCASSRAAKVEQPVATSAPKSNSGSLYQDTKLGFAVVRPSADWQLEASDFFAEEGISIPLVLRHAPTGSQVILQIAPDVATPIQYAERMTEGLRTQPGFQTSEVEPIPLTDESVGFSFALGEDVRGRVAIREGSPGNVFMVMATWPTEAENNVVETIDAIISSIQPVAPSQFARK